MLLETAVKEAKEWKNGQNTTALAKLVRLISWEILLVEINEYLQVYPKQSKGKLFFFPWNNSIKYIFFFRSKCASS